VTLVVDASVVAAALSNSGNSGKWAETLLTGESLAAPHLMPAEATNVLRRAVLRRELSAVAADVAFADLTTLPAHYFPYWPFAARIWELRANLTPYDAWYVALAEALGARLATLDTRLSRATGPLCQFIVPPSVP
jgi:predicted nucleic acid-binding protein